MAAACGSSKEELLMRSQTLKMRSTFALGDLLEGQRRLVHVEERDAVAFGLDGFLDVEADGGQVGVDGRLLARSSARRCCRGCRRAGSCCLRSRPRTFSMRADCRMRRRATCAAPKRFLRRVLPSEEVESKRAMLIVMPREGVVQVLLGLGVGVAAARRPSRSSRSPRAAPARRRRAPSAR